MKMITASIFRWMETCHRRVWRDMNVARALRDPLPPYVSAVLAGGVQHEENIHQVATPQMQRVVVRTWPQGVRLTQRFMDERVSILVAAYLELEVTSHGSSRPVRLGGVVDRLELQANGLYIA